MSVTREKNGRAWAVRDADGSLIALTLYKRGAEEVIRRLSDRDSGPGSCAQQGADGPER